jgi:hypothetical protein
MLSLGMLEEGLEVRVFFLEDGNVRITCRILVFKPIDLIFYCVPASADFNLGLYDLAQNISGLLDVL